ncbi:MAG: SWIM zinc finger family protein, partial [Thermoguttaceae bacterium]
MAGPHPFLRKLRSVLKSVDDEALASLANKGLLRRAQKDLESSPPAIVSVEEGRVRVRVADATVVVVELPSKCTCSCPATGICRHTLSALVYLRDSPELAACDGPVQSTLFDEETADAAAGSDAEPIAAPAPSPAEVLADLSDKELQKWAGKALVRKALKILAAGLPVEIEAAGSLVVRFPTRNITCRWIPSGGLLGLICSCQAENVCEHAVTAILAYQVSLGKRQITVEQAALTESAGAPRTRSEVLASVGTVLREMLSLGLARLSAATAQRLTTLAVSAHGVDLPRLERVLKSLADEVQLALRRDAQSSAANLVAQAARVEPLRTALTKSASATLVGQHRTQYYDVGQITLTGVGAQRWRSKGGYHGVTVYFWDESRKNWATWSESRPVTQPGFDAASRFRSDGPWDGCRSPQEAAESVLRLSLEFRNPQGRIS